MRTENSAPATKKKFSFKALWPVTKATAKEWMAADPFRQSAVIAYYAIFSMPGLLVIVIAVAGLAFGREAVQGEVSNQIGTAIDKGAAEQIEDMIAKASDRKDSIVATILSILTLIFGSTGVFAQLQISLNRIWRVKVTAKKKWLKTVRDRLFSFGLVISIAFLLLISLVITAGLAAFSEWLKGRLPDVVLILFQLLNFVISAGVISVLFALMFRILPDVKVRWRNVWVGAIVTALLFTLGKFGLGIYFGKAEPASAYGAAGSIVLLMLWVSYSCMIVFFGAEFTKQYTLFYDGKIEPAKNAELIEDEDDAHEHVSPKQG
jgi:membrane protein